MAQKHNISDTEYPMTRMGTIQQPSRRYRRLRHPSFTAAVWTANNPLLQRGEFGSEIDTGKLKIGDGVTYWNDLGYVAASEIAFADITGSPDDNVALKNALDAKQDVLTEGTGIDIDSDNIISNTGVRSVATGTTNGTISVNTGGTSAEVAVYGLGSAAYTASSDYATAAQGILASTAVQPGDLATVATSGAFSDLTGKPTTLSGYGITDGANTSLSNLTSTGANISNWSSNVSNCITEIPQDIKLELAADGTLTLKAGSKVYVPNGAGVFDVQTISSDKTTTRTATSVVQRLVFYTSTDGLAVAYDMNKISSGTTDSLAGQSYHVWYDTTNNSIKMYGSDSSTPQYTGALPLGIITIDGANGISSIDQVFNGFGYVGSTVFALPGVKGLAPNGINSADGTLNSNVINDSTVRTYTVSGTYNFILAKTANAIGAYFYAYDPVNNYIYRTDTNARYYGDRYIFGSCRVESGVIKSFSTKQPFHAVDYSDTEFIAHQAMPSSRYVDLTLPANGGSVTAPADGYITIAKATGSANEYVSLNSSSLIQQNACCPITGFNIRLIIPVSKGDVITINYTTSGATQYFRFVYANGAK